MKDREKHSITPFEKWVDMNYKMSIWWYDNFGVKIYLDIKDLDPECYSTHELKDKYIEYLEEKNKEYYKFSKN